MLLWPWLLGAGLVVLVIDLAVRRTAKAREQTASCLAVRRLVRRSLVSERAQSAMSAGEQSCALANWQVNEV